jgi:hypothetical protein
MIHNVLIFCILIVSSLFTQVHSSVRTVMTREIQIAVIEVLTEEETAKYICMSRSFLRQDRMNGYRKGRTRGPAYVKLGRAVRYRKQDLDNWILANRVTRSLPY